MDAVGWIGQIQRLANQHRAALLRGERTAALEMTQAYGTVWERIQANLDRLLADQTAAIARGDITQAEAMTWTLQRLDTLQTQAAREMGQFAKVAGTTVTTQQHEAALLAIQHAEEMVTGLNVQWTRLPTSAITDLVGHTRTGSPLRTLLDNLGAAASDHVRSRLIEGVALGQNPRVVARHVREDFGGDLARALRVSRTETIRAYRESTRRNYQANSDVVACWRWTAAKQGRTCAACLAMDGTLHSLDEPLDGHPNCRCTPVPVVRGYEDYYNDYESGSAWLAKQNETTQRQVLGPAYDAYTQGKIQLGDLVAQHQSTEWGSYRTVRPISTVLPS